MFVASKADEIARRLRMFCLYYSSSCLSLTLMLIHLEHLSNQIHRLILRCATSGQDRMTLKRRQRFAKYEQTLLQCDDDAKSLQRFVAAQVVAFRKILKKYRKWTGSAPLGSRFKDNVLADPKSFTRRDFSQLETLHDDLAQTLHGALPPDPPGGYLLSEPEDQSPRSPSPPSSQASPGSTEAATDPQPSAGYWNEYECGSEAGDFDGHAGNDYAIYIDPNQDDSFPGIKALGVFLSKPFHKLTGWMAFPHRKPTAGGPEHAPLLPGHHSPTATPPNGSARSPPELGYFSTSPGGTAHSYTTAGAGTDTEFDEDDSRFPSHRHSRRNSGSFPGLGAGYTSSSSDDQHNRKQQSYFLPSQGYVTHHAAGTHRAGYTLPSLAHQRVARYRERVLAYATWGCYAAAVVLMGIAAVLIATGRHRMRLEVDAAALVGIVSSLGAACGGLCMAGARHDSLGWVGRSAVWGAFGGVCVVNGVLLILVTGNASRV